MTDRDRKPWWELDPEERPVPLDAGGGWAAADDAELFVNLEREAIIREDTEPNLATLTSTGHDQRTIRRRALSVSRSGLAAAALSLAIGCVAMFAWGWNQGAAVAADRHQPSVGEESTMDADVAPATKDPRRNASLKDSQRGKVNKKGDS